MTFGYIIGAAVLLLILWLGDGIRRIGSVSVGKMVGERGGSALLLIDLQSVFWDRGPYSDASKQSASTVILDEVAAARAQNQPVIAVRQEWAIPSTKVLARLTMRGQAIEGSEGTELAGLFSSCPEHVIVKRVQDAFETGELDALLERLNVGKLRLVGLDLNYCVQRTALAARNRGYDVTVMKHGTLAAGPTEVSEKRMSSAGVVFS
jgi:nicotinamidase/pyrazinamidase